MRRVLRWGVAVVVVIHGLIHVLGAANGLGWADVPALKQPIGAGIGILWLAAALVVIVSGVLLAACVRWWWRVGAAAVVVSQAMIFTSWGDAKAGTAANVVLAISVAYGFASQGPRSFRAAYRRQVTTAIAGSDRDRLSTELVTEADLAPLPGPVATYVSRSGAVGKPRIAGFRAQIHGRIRARGNSPWMRFTGEQVNTYGDEPRRLFFMDATMRGVPVDVLHVYAGSTATMRVKVASLVPKADASGPEMDQAETVTLFNDLCLLAPAALVDAPVRWQPVDSHHALGSFTAGDHTVSAMLTFDDDGDLTDFVSEDRLRASQDGSSFTAQRWSTPVQRYRTFETRRVVSSGEGHWHAPEPEGDVTYLEFNVDDLIHLSIDAGRGAEPGSHRV